MAAASLLEAIRVADRVATRSTNTSKVCRNQCRIFVAAFSHVRDFLKQIQDLNLASNGRAFVWDETVAVLKRGLHLLRSCQEGDWIARSLLFEESCDEFQSIYPEIYNCVEVVSVYLFQLAPSSSHRSIVEAYNSCLMRKNSSSMLEEAGRSDRKELMALAMSQEPGSLTTESERAKEILCSMLLGNKSVINHKELKLRTHLGQGAYGTVYEAIWLGHKFAVKVFAQGDTSFAKELAVLGAQKHPNVLHIAGHSFDGEKRQYSLVMEKMDMDLANYLLKKKSSLPLLSIVAVMLEVATGMAWLHSRNIIHRDLKPQNILVAEEDNILVSIRIADFGVSRPDFISSRISDPTGRQGTKNFMAPEVWSSERYTKKADVYSYGMLSYQLVTGNVPFKPGMDMKQVLRGERPEIPATCPEFLSQLMQECWSHNAKERPSFSDICERLKLLKSKMITGTESLDKLRAKLVEAANSSSSSSSSYSSSSSLGEHSRTRVNLDSLVQATQKLRTQNLPTSPSPIAQPVPHRPHHVASAPKADKRTELFELVKKGLIINAFEKALSLGDPSTVWWLCTKVQHTVLLVFTESMVMALAEQINNNFTEDTARRLVWINEIGELLLKDNNAWASPRKLRFLEQLSQNLHGVIAITPRKSELGMKLTYMLAGTNMWLQRVRVAVDNKVRYMSITGGYFPAEHR